MSAKAGKNTLDEETLQCDFSRKNHESIVMCIVAMEETLDLPHFRLFFPQFFPETFLY